MKNTWTEKYLTTYGTKFSRRQKKEFAKEIIKDFEKLGYKTHVQDLKISMKKVQNILIGNFKMAKTILVIPYDTQSRIFFPNYKYYPQNGMKSMKKNFIPIYTPMLALYLVLIGLIYGLPMIMENSELLVYLLTLSYFILLLIFIWRGFPNKNNVTANNLSTILALDLMASLPVEKRKQIAIVFTDKNNAKMTGSKVLAKYMKTINKATNMILLNCIGQADTVSILYPKGQRKEAQKLSKNCPIKNVVKQAEENKVVQLPIQELENAILISTGEMIEEDITVKQIRTHKDTEFDLDVYEAVKEMLYKQLG